MNVESLRQQHRPQQVRVLLIGESPPVGGTFFYAANSNLFRYTREAFEQATGRRWKTGSDFLDYFVDQGFYLDDLCTEPVNGMDRRQRRRCCRSSVPGLANRLKEMAPIAVALTPKSIKREVARALDLAGYDITPVALPFPAMSWQSAYVEAMTDFLRSLASSRQPLVLR
jgi:hypothetical protein